MSYKIIDGVAYKCEEVDLADVRVEVNQAKAVINEQSKKLADINANIEIITSQTAKQIESYRTQIASIEATIANLENKKVAAVVPLENQKSECNEKIAKVREQLAEKQDIITALLPDDAKLFGF